MDNGDRHVNMKRKIVGPGADTNDLLDLSLTIKPFVHPTDPSQASPPPPLSSSPVHGHISTSEALTSAGLSPWLNPSITDYWEIFQASTLTSPIYHPRPPSPTSSPSSLSLTISRNVYPAANLNSPMPYAWSPPSPPVPVYQNFFPTAPVNYPILSPQPSLSRPPPTPSLSISSNFFPTVTLPRNSQESSGDRDGHPRQPRSRRNPSQLPRGGKSIEIVPPYPWSTNRRCTVLSLQHLLSIQLDTITGEVQCKRCERNYEMGFDLRQKLFEVFQFIIENKNQMHDRAPDAWTNPALPQCRFCEEENSVKPIISDKKKTVNWLFLLLGQMLGCCTLGQLKYFCKHTKNHRTGAKDRVLYLTYMGLCKQLDPNGPFDR